MRTALLAVALAGCAVEGDVLRSGQDGGGGDSGAAADGSGAGDGGPDCPATGPCPDPPAGDITVCGRVLDLQDSTPVTANPPAVRIYDALDFATDPDGPPAATVVPDGCGWFTATVDSSLGYHVLHTGEPSGGDWRRVVQVIDPEPGQTVRANGWSLRTTTDLVWSAAAGLGGQSFAEIGAAVLLFVDLGEPAVSPLQGAPVAGVTVTVGGQDVAADDFYFADSALLARAQLAPGQAVTGADGTGLLRDPPGPATSLGGDRAGCGFAQVNTLFIGGLIQVAELAGTCN